VSSLPCLSPRANLAETACEVPHQALTLLHEVCFDMDARRLLKRLRTLLPTSPALPLPSQCLIHSETAVEHELGSRAAPPDDGFQRRGAVLAGLGHATAAACMWQLAGRTLQPGRSLMARSQREDMWKALLRRERDVFGCACALWPEDVEVLVNSVWGRRCALSGECLGGEKSLVLTRWERVYPASLGNTVLLTKQLAEEHDAADVPFALIEPQLVEAVRQCLASAVVTFS